MQNHTAPGLSVLYLLPGSPLWIIRCLFPLLFFIDSIFILHTFSSYTFRLIFEMWVLVHVKMKNFNKDKGNFDVIFQVVKVIHAAYKNDCFYQ